MKKKLIGILISLTMLMTLMLGTTSLALAGDAPVIKVLIPIAGVVSKDNYVPYSTATIKMNGNYTVVDNGNPANAAALNNGETYTVNLSTSDGRTYPVGDADMNGSISISDYTNVRLHILGKKALTGEPLALADVDKNGAVTISDYTYIRLHILGLRPITDTATFGKANGITVCASSGATVFTAPDFKIYSTTGTDTLELITERSGYGTRNYRGAFRFYMGDNSLRLVNELDLETYLYGVLPYEMNNDFPMEALKAQAVCARNFAFSRMGQPNYDLDDTSSYAQVYRGFDASKNNCIAAVDGTRGQIMKYGDTVMECYYSASNGGWTEITQHRWSVTALKAYDQIKADPYDTANPSSQQERIVLPASLSPSSPIKYQKWVNGSYVDATDIPSDVNSNVSYYLRLRALQAVSALGYVANFPEDMDIISISNIANKTYDTNSGQHHDINDVTGKNDCKDFLQAEVTMKVNAAPASGGGRVPVDVTFTINYTDIGPAGAYPSLFNSSLGIYFAEYESANAVWYINHRRYGHGIGLSQRGAQQRACDPDPAVNTYTAILDFYFPDYPGYPDVHLDALY